MKKILIIVGTILLVISMAAIVNAEDERSWCFKDSAFDSLKSGVITAPITINGLTLSTELEINESKGPVKAFYFEKSVYTKSYGGIENGYIKFSVNGDTDIHILGRSKSNVQNRPLNIYTTSDKKTGTISMTPNTEDYIYNYRGSACDVYLYTPGAGVRLYSITAKNYSASDNKYPQLIEGQKKVWDFENYEEYRGSITQNLNLDGMEIKATASYPVKIEINTSNYAPSGYHKYTYLNLVGVPKGESRQISFPVNKNSDVYISARSSDGTSKRNLLMWNQYYGTPKTSINGDTIEVGESLETFKISYYGDGEVFNICSKDSGIKIFKISVVPRVKRVIDDKKWDISNSINFSEGEYVNSTIDGLNLINLSVENNVSTGNQKSIHIRSGLYNYSGRIKFDISDSSNPRGASVKRTITIKAKSAYDEQMKLVLINSDDYIIGSTSLTTKIAEYKFDYTDSYDSIYVYAFYPSNKSSAGAYIYSIDNGVREFIGPEDSNRIVSVTSGQKYQYYFTASNIDPDAFTYKISYNQYALTPKYIGYGDGKDNHSTEGISIIKNEKGEIVYTVGNSSNNWSGTTISVIFEAKSTGSTNIGYIAEPIL